MVAHRRPHRGTGASSRRGWQRATHIYALGLFRVSGLSGGAQGSTQGHWRFPASGLEQGYAYLLSHPGTPCVFYDHLEDRQLAQVLQRLIALRLRAGTHCRSEVGAPARLPRLAIRKSLESLNSLNTASSRCACAPASTAAPRWGRPPACLGSI